ncbi:MAG: hypothetical protein V3R99_06730 [Thermoguttaceae bacterium]
MRLPVFHALILSASLGLLASFVLAQDAPKRQLDPQGAKGQASIAREHHPWGRFEPGAWKLVHVVTETLDEKGEVASTSTTETKTTLVKVEKDGVTLKVEVSVKVAGKVFDAEPQTVKQGFHGELIGEQLKIKEAGKGEVTIEQRKIPCQVLRLENSGSTSNTVTNLYYSAQVAPHILRRESVTTDLDGDTILSETTVNVVTLNAQCEGFDQMQLIRVEEIHKHPKGTVTTTALTSPNLPGGIIQQKSEELDENGRAIRHITLEMVKYGLEEESERTGILSFFGRNKRTGTARKPPKRTER